MSGNIVIEYNRDAARLSKLGGRSQMADMGEGSLGISF
jgi:hypothetical protein